jgi:DNA-binding YbaB/EbfC family protein
MLDALKNLGNLRELMSQAAELKTKMNQLQEEMAKRTTTADAGGGMVTATVNGRLELTALKIDKSRLADPNDTEMLEDLIVSAVRAAQAKIAAEMQTEMQKLAGGLGLPPGVLPGM